MRHSPNAALWERVWRVLVPSVEIGPGWRRLTGQSFCSVPGRVRGVAGCSTMRTLLFFRPDRGAGVWGEGALRAGPWVAWSPVLCKVDFGKLPPWPSEHR
jgi:hypothetical protein